MKIAYLINDMYGIGGTVRTVANQAAALSARHEVEIVSVFRHRAEPVLPVPAQVSLRPLVDIRQQGEQATGVDGRPLYEGSERAGLPPLLFPVEDGRSSTHSRLTDDRLEEYLATTDADVVVGTRPGLNVVIARAAPRRVVKVGQEHLTYEQHSRELRQVMAAEYPNLDAFVTVTEADARTYAERMPMPGVRLLSIPNSVPAPPFTVNGQNSRTIVSAGRLAPSKRHDLLVQAFSMVSDEFPDWTLRIYGRGSRRGALGRLVGSLGLQDRVWLMGPHPRVEEAWAQGAFAAVTSSEEPFGMTIVEAMRSGLPVVSTDCPHGPASIIRDREDGLLVPNKSAPGIAEGLAQLMGDDQLRRRMSAAALTDSERFDPANVVRMHEELFAELAGAGAPSPPTPHLPAPRPEPPASCRVEAGPDGAAVLWFGLVEGVAGSDAGRIPERVVLAKSGRRIELLPEADGRVVVDASRRATEVGGGAEAVGSGVHDQAVNGPGAGGSGPGGSTTVAAPLKGLVTGEWQVFRVDGGVEAPVRDVEIHQHGFPMPAADTEELSLVVPARSTKGRLVLHVRRSAHHAEIEHVEIADGLITVQGRVLGRQRPDARARLVVRLRTAAQTRREFPSAVTASGEFTAVIDPEVVVRGREGDSEKWQMLLILSDGTECTVGRHLSGVVGYKRIIEYASQQVRPVRGIGCKVRPYYTVNDRLGLLTAPLAPTMPVDRVRVRPVGRRGDRLLFEVALGSPAPEGTAFALEVVRGTNAGQRYPLEALPHRPGREEGRLVGTLPLLAHNDYRGVSVLRASWQLRLKAGPAGALAKVGAKAVPDQTARRWSHGAYVRSVTVAPTGSGDMKVTVADVHVAEALNRRLR
ncbi:glycosyltransferase family 4 protein [Nocardiopsis metallicus]|uniref:Glycosyltransferase involved in cell wall biosynthesis n=1 Tax=Nocardiopsis metallicus TaxID=179819 RepID=A0A840WW06_9ACTN|nr:glycosyltransferase family 4 protein [Nocardiopsis metallicus]MBB5495716.1 glycosyltransferase involved in cell wall biosynthesis [Nocardiopsis metallicus]